MSKYGYLKVFQRVPSTSRKRELTVLCLMWTYYPWLAKKRRSTGGVVDLYSWLAKIMVDWGRGRLVFLTFENDGRLGRGRLVLMACENDVDWGVIDLYPWLAKMTSTGAWLTCILSLRK